MDKQNVQTIIIHISARRLSINSTFVRCLLVQNNQQKVIGKTQILDNNINPDYAQVITCQYYLHKVQHLKFQVVDENTKTIGYAQCTLDQLIGSKMNSLIKKINNCQGKLIIRSSKQLSAEAIHYFCKVQLTNIQPQSTSCFCLSFKTKYGIKISKILQNQQRILIGKGQKKQAQQSCTWNFEIKTGEGKGVLYVQGLYAQGVFNFEQLKTNKSKRVQLQSKNKHIEVECYVTIQQFPYYPFLDYILGGLQLALEIYIDFSSYNGNWRDKKAKSLHHINENNFYMQAIKVVGQILICYDYDKKIPINGFGGECDLQKKKKEVFSLSKQNEWCKGVKQLLKCYQNCLSHIKPLDSCKYSSLIPQKYLQNQYKVLLILTSGNIDDQKEFMDKLVQLADKPISIIIVGIGKRSQWKAMQKLDDDEMVMKNKEGDRTKRDLVQFVQFQKYKDNMNKLSQKLLQQLPRQLQQYAMFNMIKPNPPIMSSIKQLYKINFDEQNE